jgi:hypothetical protein
MTRIGLTLLQVQVTEHILQWCIGVVRLSEHTWQEIERLETKERKKTLGYFVAELRKIIDIDQEFEAVLMEFVDRRNTFVHHLKQVPGYNLKDEAGLNAAMSFVTDLFARAVHVRKTLWAFGGILSGRRLIDPELVIKEDMSDEEFYDIIALMALKPRA